jgi:glycine dehydrogenase subunit 2
MHGVAMTPKAGAHGELCGLPRAALEARGDAREVILVPESAHGTNPATAAFAGYRVENIPATEDGRVDVAALTARLGPDVAGVMITNPNTCGLFERDSRRLPTRSTRRRLCLLRRANFNAIVGRVRPGDLGVDAMHINLHKTFSTPHGGGGPGSGRSCCRKRSRLMPAAVHRAAGRRFGAAGRGRRRARHPSRRLRPDVRVPWPDGHVHARWPIS